MGTYCAIHVKVKDKTLLVPELERFLAETHRGQVIQTTTAETLGQLYGAEFLVSTEPPTTFALIAEQPDWVTAHFNSFLRPRDLSVQLSGNLNAVVVAVMAQTCSSAYFLSICDSGRHRRTLELAHGEWIAQEGPFLPFESEPLGKNVAEPGEEPWYRFEQDSVREYCEHLGLRLWRGGWTEAEQPEFTIIRALPRRVYAG